MPSSLLEELGVANDADPHEGERVRLGDLDVDRAADEVVRV